MSTIINPPFGEVIQPPTRAKRKHFKKTFRVFGLYFTISDCRVKLRLGCQDHKHQTEQTWFWKLRQEMYQTQECRCPMCGEKFDLTYMEVHHVLPWSRYPELRKNRDNLMLLCHDCHKNIHCDPWVNIRLMESKAEELGVELRYLTQKPQILFEHESHELHE